MSAIAASSSWSRAFRFYDVYVGKKAVMAVTGFMLFGYVVGHMLGNLQIFIPPENGVYQINTYAHFLHAHYVLLWCVRTVLLAAVGWHIIAAFQLWLLKHKARPIAYCKKDDVPTAFAARTMLWSGPIIAAYLVFHILHLTTGNLNHQYEELQAYQNLVHGFRDYAFCAVYIAAMIVLCTHLYHGIWSMLHSLGWDDEHYRPILQRLSAVVSILIAIGYIAVPIAVMTGLIGGEVR
jgi:succinate dehydrogenase / fumarate reductase cytochrome b subunit